MPQDVSAPKQRAQARAGRRFRLALATAFSGVVLGLLVLDGVMVGGLWPELRVLTRMGESHVRAVSLATELRDSVSEMRQQLVAAGRDGRAPDAPSIAARTTGLEETAHELDRLAETGPERLAVAKLKAAVAQCALDAARLREAIDSGNIPAGMELQPILEAAARGSEAADEVVLLNARQIQRSTSEVHGSLAWLIALTVLLTTAIIAAALLLFRRALRSAAEHAALMQAHANDLAEFASRAAHELRTPLQTLMLALRLARKGRADVLDRAEASARRLSDTIHDILEFSRAGVEVVSPGSARVEAVIDEVAENLALTSANAGIALERGVAPGLEVAMESGHLRIVLMNLVGNAVKYAAVAPDARVRVQGRTRGSTVELVVSDNGPGIPSAALPFLFEPHFRATAHRVGYGLGLATVKRLVEAYGGHIAVSSEVGRGTTFAIELPARGDSPPPAP